MSSTQEFNAFPSIGHLRHLQKALSFQPWTPDIIEYRGTVKLHGCNTAVCQDAVDSDIFVQSRNRILSLEADNHGCFSFVTDRLDHFKGIINRIRIMRPEAASIKVFGEYAGQKIQCGVGISKAPKFFCIFTIYIDGQAQDTSDFSDIHDNENRIFNVMQFGTYSVKINKADPMASAEEIDRLTKEVSEDCPAGRFIGFPGMGEGIVWTMQGQQSCSRIWFKSVVENFSDTIAAKVKVPKAVDPDTDTEKVDDFVEKFAHDKRMNQGLDHLREFNKPIDNVSIGAFVKWVTDDMLKEEGDILNAKEKNVCRQLASKKAVTWFKSFLKSA